MLVYAVIFTVFIVGGGGGVVEDKIEVRGRQSEK